MITLAKRLEQIRSSLLSEGWLYVGQCAHQEDTMTIMYRNPKGNRFHIEVNSGAILMFRNRKLVKQEFFPP